MDLQILRFFVASADAGSFSSAADRLHYAQSNLSTRIAQLETELGEPLFYRYKKGITLTAKGNILYHYAIRILSLADEAVIAVQDHETAKGQLQLGSIEATALGDLPSLFASYHQKYPEVSLSLQTELNDVFTEKVLSRRLDGAFVTGPVDQPLLEEIPFRTDELIFVGNESFSEYSVDELLRRAPLITFPDGSSFRRRLELLLASRGLSLTDRLTTLNSLAAMIANISAGLGCGYLPRSIVEQYLRNGLMCEYPVDSPYSRLNVVFIYRRDHVQDAAFRYFLEMLRESA